MAIVKCPPVEFFESEPLTDHYHDGYQNRWTVARLIELSKDFPVYEIPLISLDLSARIWSDCNILDYAAHMRRVMDADLNFPILLDWEGGIADGRHRIIKAIAERRTHIKAKRFTFRPTPCSDILVPTK